MLRLLLVVCLSCCIFTLSGMHAGLVEAGKKLQGLGKLVAVTQNLSCLKGNLCAGWRSMRRCRECLP